MATGPRAWSSSACWIEPMPGLAVPADHNQVGAG